METLSDPKLIGPILTAILVTLIIPMIKDHRKTSKSQKNLLRMLREDITERVAMFDQFEISLLSGIDKAQKNPNYLPVLLEAKGLDDYINWKDEKWLLPTNRAGRILKFYNEQASITSVINFTATDRFSDLARERKLGLYELLLEDVRSARDIGAALAKLLESDGC